MNKIISILEKIEKYTLIFIVFVFPIVLVPSTYSPFDLPKIAVLYFTVIILSLSKIIKTVIRKEGSINKSGLDIFALSISLAYLLSTLFTRTNRIDAMFLPGHAGFVILGAALYFLINQESDQTKKTLSNVFIGSIFLGAVVQIISFTGITKLLPISELFKFQTFNIFGNIFTYIVIGLAILPVIFSRIGNKAHDVYEKILSILVALVLGISVSLTAYLAFSDKSIYPSILEFKYGINLTMDSFKENVLFGSGPTNFGYIFNKYKPLEYNNDEQWNLKYIQGSSLGLTTTTETGLLGLVSILILLYILYANYDFKNPLYISSLIVTVGIILLPVSVSIYALLLIIMSFSASNKPKNISLFENRPLKNILSFVSLVLLIALGYLVSRGLYAEYKYNQASLYATKNDAIKAYESINAAVNTNQYVDRYHLFSASLNLSIADAMARKENVTDEEKDTISKLVQQSIREIKASVGVNPRKSANWEAMSDLYRIIMSFAKGADAFAVESIRQAIVLDPIDPLLRIKLGSLYYTLGQYEAAIEANKLAVVAKPNFPNAHYNLALSYKANKDIIKAKESINNTLRLIGKDGVDYEKALKELAELDALTTPEEKVDPKVEPQIELPAEDNADNENVPAADVEVIQQPTPIASPVPQP